MTRHRSIGSLLLATGALMIAACASQPVSTSTAEASLAEKNFQQTAQHYQKFQHDGQTVYCKKEKVITSAIPATRCLTEAALREQVHNAQRSRNAVSRPVVAGTGQGGIG
jgi:hypothetical protein